MSTAPILLGHRGARSLRSVPENSIVSFDLALEHGCDGVEFDLRLTGCGRALVCHNLKVGKITVSRATSRQLLHLPRLEDVLRHYGHRIFLDIELKVRGLESKVLSALRERPTNLNYVVSSFIPEVIMELRARSATVPTGIVCQKASQLIHWRKLPVQYIIVHYSLVNRRLINLIHAARRKVFVWTVNDAKSMVRFSNWGVDGIISDDTQLLVRTLRN